jgi:hypothetical protein
MSEAEEFDRTEVSVGEEYRHDRGLRNLGRNGAGHPDVKPGMTAREPLPRAVGSPLPIGNSAKSPLSVNGEGPGRTSTPPPGRALSVAAQSESESSSGMQWALGVMKQAVPFVQRLLPLLDGQIATAVANLLARPHAPAPPPRVDLQPIENSVTELHRQQRDFKDQLADHNMALKRVEDHLGMVREATDRNTLEQQELIEDLKAMGNRVNLLALLFLGLLVVSVLLNVFLFLHIQRVLP